MAVAETVGRAWRGLRAQERSQGRDWDKGEGKVVKVAKKAWSVSGQPREGGDPKAQEERVGKMWHKNGKPWPWGEQAVIASDMAVRAGRRLGGPEAVS